jgi:hypothetical protein
MGIAIDDAGYALLSDVMRLQFFRGYDIDEAIEQSARIVSDAGGRFVGESNGCWQRQTTISFETSGWQVLHTRESRLATTRGPLMLIVSKRPHNQNY